MQVGNWNEYWLGHFSPSPSKLPSISRMRARREVALSVNTYEEGLRHQCRNRCRVMVTRRQQQAKDGRVSQSAQHLIKLTFSRRNQNRQDGSALVMSAKDLFWLTITTIDPPILLLYRHEMSAFFFQSHSSSQHPQGPRAGLDACCSCCVYSPRRLDTSLCRARRAPVVLPAAGQGTTKIVDANQPISKLREAIPSYDAEERDYLIRTIAFDGLR